MALHAAEDAAQRRRDSAFDRLRRGLHSQAIKSFIFDSETGRIVQAPAEIWASAAGTELLETGRLIAQLPGDPLTRWSRVAQGWVLVSEQALSQYLAAIASSAGPNSPGKADSIEGVPSPTERGSAGGRDLCRSGQVTREQMWGPINRRLQGDNPNCWIRLADAVHLIAQELNLPIGAARELL